MRGLGGVDPRLGFRRIDVKSDCDDREPAGLEFGV
jgi:hypothetical protein